MCVAWIDGTTGAIRTLDVRNLGWPDTSIPTRCPTWKMATTVLFCLIDDRYRLLNPRGARRYESIKRLSDSEIITLALLQQLRGVESERSFLRDDQRFFSHLFPGEAGLHPSSFNRRVRKLRHCVEPNRQLRWLGHLWVPGLLDAEHSLATQPLEENRVRFIQSEMFNGVLVPLLARSLDNNTLRGFEEMNGALKEQAEAVPSRTDVRTPENLHG